VGERHLVIIGGGAGGLVVASVAAQLGLKTTLVEKGPTLGGDCLHFGCVPSKSLIYSARVAHLQRRAADFGLAPQNVRADLALVNKSVRAVIEKILVHDDPERFRGYGCEILFGTAAFEDDHTIRVNEQRIRARRVVIATGSRPLVPAIPGLGEAGFVTNEDVLSLPTLPERLAVLGAGPVGLEMAQAFARLGSRVTVIERLPRILPLEDLEVAGRLQEILAAEGIGFRLGTTAERVERVGDTRVVHTSDGARVEADALLIAVGRRPNIEGLGLEKIGVACDERGIKVDARQRTTLRHIYACGDVCGPYPFTHVAEYQAGIVIANALFRLPKKADYRVVPWATFTDPELARVGLSEEQARARGFEPEILRFPFESVDRALCEREPFGLVKFVTHRGRVLGASILGPRAAELIHEVALVMRRGGRLRDLTDAIHVYPTLAQSLRRAANTHYAGVLFSARTRTLVKWINRLLP
jgi:pyruvate/2-oxoglutarate dehydrogenase complex dihydrolipoamide dehydrogenase (E3) component